MFADLLTRWSRGDRLSKATCRRVPTICQQPLTQRQKSGELETTEIKKGRKDLEVPTVATRSDEGIKKISGKIWIPEEANDLKARTMISAHCGSGGHREIDATENRVREKF